MRHGLLAAGCSAAALGLGLAPAHAATPADTMVIAWNIDAISTFDPAQIAEVVTDEILMNICDALVDFHPDDTSQFIPALAESWDVSEDGRTITFHLKDGIVFPDGTPGTAADLLWGMERVVNLGYGNAAQLTEYGFTSETISEAITAPDDRTLVMQLDQAYPVNLIMGSIAANRVSVMLNRAAIEPNAEGDDLGNAWLASRTDCVGPYSLARWNAGEVVVLEANENYTSGDAPFLQRVVIRHVSESGTQRLMLEQGDVDVARNLTPEDIIALEGAEGIDVAQVPAPTMYYLGMNNSHEAFSDPRVRLAMRYLIDYQGLGDSVMRGVGVPRASYVPLGSFGALDEEAGQPFSFDPDRARELLAEAGYADGFTATLLVGSAPFAAPIAQTVQENAAQAGVILNIELMANAQLFARHRGRDFEGALLGFRPSVPDAHGMSSRHVYNPDNSLEAQLTQYPSWRSAYYDEAANAAVEAALFESDPETREQMYHDLQVRMMEEGPQAYIMQYIESAAHRTALQDWTWNSFRMYFDRASK